MLNEEEKHVTYLEGETIRRIWAIYARIGQQGSILGRVLRESVVQKRRRLRFCYVLHQFYSR